eukprot:Opistho-1_new@58869
MRRTAASDDPHKSRNTWRASAPGTMSCIVVSASRSVGGCSASAVATRGVIVYTFACCDMCRRDPARGSIASSATAASSSFLSSSDTTIGSPSSPAAPSPPAAPWPPFSAPAESPLSPAFAAAASRGAAPMSSCSSSLSLSCSSDINASSSSADCAMTRWASFPWRCPDSAAPWLPSFSMRKRMSVTSNTRRPEPLADTEDDEFTKVKTKSIPITAAIPRISERRERKYRHNIFTARTRPHGPRPPTTRVALGAAPECHFFLATPTHGGNHTHTETRAGAVSWKYNALADTGPLRNTESAPEKAQRATTPCTLR